MPPRDEGADILILARSDARQAESLDEALWRAAAFADAGADILFIDALASEEEMRAFTSLGGAAARLPKVGACARGRWLEVGEGQKYVGSHGLTVWKQGSGKTQRAQQYVRVECG